MNDDLITDLLLDLGVPINLSGFHYLRDSIKIAIADPFIKMMKLYEKVSLGYPGATISRVERAMRHAIEISFNRGNVESLEDIFKYSWDITKGKPTNAEFIKLIADRFRRNKDES